MTWGWPPGWGCLTSSPAHGTQHSLESPKAGVSFLLPWTFIIKEDLLGVTCSTEQSKGKRWHLQKIHSFLFLLHGSIDFFCSIKSYLQLHIPIQELPGWKISYSFFTAITAPPFFPSPSRRARGSLWLGLSCLESLHLVLSTRDPSGLYLILPFPLIFWPTGCSLGYLLHTHSR
jgi:hypothetical protein